MTPTHTTPRRLALALAAAALLPAQAAGSATADDPKGGPARTVLFDGKTLDGWVKTPFVHAGEVKVADGAIVMAAGQPMTGVTCTHKDLPTTDYELTYEARRDAGHDFFAAATFPVGKSFLTLVNGGWSGTITGLSSLDGMDASENQTGQPFEYKNKTWYRFRVWVTGKAVRCWVDDKPVVTVSIEGHEVGTRIETRECQPLGFAAWDTAGSVRNIALRKLTPREVAETDEAADKAG